MTDTAADHDRQIDREHRRPLLGALLLAAGALWLVNQTHVVHLSAEVLPSVLLIAIGFSLVMTGRRRQGPGLVIAGGVVTLVLLSASPNVRTWVPHANAADSVHPVSVGALQSSYDKGVGDLRIDLTAVPLEQGTTSLEARVGAGNLTIVVPDGVGVRVDANDGVGDVIVLGDSLGGGVGTHQTWTSGDYDQAGVRLDLHLRVGAGNIVVDSGPSVTQSPTLLPPKTPAPAPVPTTVAG